MTERDNAVVQEKRTTETARSEWRNLTLGEVMTLQRGFDLPKPKRVLGPYPVIASTGQVGTHHAAAVNGPGVVIGRSGSLGGGQFVRSDFWPLNTTLWVKDFQGNDRRFCYYFLKSLDLSLFNAGSGVPTLNRNHIHPLPVKIPSVITQRAIAHVLGTLDDKIELTQRMNETLEEMARALFKSWFVDFDPVRAKMEGRWQRGESLPGLPAEHYDLFPDRLVDSELGEVPEGWGVKGLGDVIEFHDSRRVPLNSRQRANRQGPYPYYGAAGIIDYVDDFLFDGVYVLTGEDGSVSDTDGHPIVQYIWGQFWANNHAHVLKGRNGISEEHLYLLLRQVSIIAVVTGAVQPKLSQRNLKAVPVVFAGKSVCGAFSGLIGPLFERIRDNADESKLLTAQRDALLPGLVSGEVRVWM